MRLLLSLVLFFPLALGAQSYRLVKLVEGLDHPWSLAFLPDGRMLVTERPGRLRIISQGKLDPNPIKGVPEVVEQGQGGLFDVAVHPAISQNRFIYLAYNARGQDGTGTELARARLAEGRLEDVQVLFRQ